MSIRTPELNEFYANSQLGGIAKTTLEAVLKRLWPSFTGMFVVGFGFAHPLLERPQRDSLRVVNLSTDANDPVRWPDESLNSSVVAEERQWPLAAGIADRILILHGLEFSSDPDMLLEECRRVLADGGRTAIIVPNRVGMWARSDASPFGLGSPYSSGRLVRLLNKHRLVIKNMTPALFTPPSHRKFWLKSAPTLERLASGLPAPFGLTGGVLVAEAEKVAFEPNRPALRATVLDSLVRPAAEPA